MRSRVAVFGLLVLLCVACGPSAKERALKATLVSLNAARDGFLAFDEEYQKQILDTSATREEFTPRIVAYREKQTVVVQSFVVAYSALAAACLNPSVEMLVEAAKAAKAVYDLVKGIRETTDAPASQPGSQPASQPVVPVLDDGGPPVPALAPTSVA